MYTHTMQNLPNYTVLNMQYILYRLSDTVHLISMRSVKILKDCLTIICQCFGSGIHKDQDIYKFHNTFSGRKQCKV